MWTYKKAKKLKKLIDESSLTRKELAAYIGIEQQSLNNILCGSHNPSRAVIKLMAQALKITVEDLAPSTTKAG